MCFCFNQHFLREVCGGCSLKGCCCMGKVIASLDPVGLSSFYWSQGLKNELICDSSFKSLLEKMELPFVLSPESIHSYLHHMCVAPMTPLQDCWSLLPGHRLLLEDSGDVRIERYWSVEESPAIPNASSCDPVLMIREQLLKSVEKAADSGSTIGVPLSGGLDSSIVACVLKHLGVPFTAFTVGWKGHPRTDERKLAEQLVEYLDIPHVEMELDTKSLVENFPDVVAALEVPIADITAYAFYELFRRMREDGVTLCLSGDGADELFWGGEWARDAVRENELVAQFKEKYKVGKKGLSLKDSAVLFLKCLYPIDGFYGAGETLKDWLMLMRPLRRRYPYAKAAFGRIEKILSSYRELGVKTRVFYDLNPEYMEAEYLLPQFYKKDFFEKVRHASLEFPCFLEDEVSVDVLVTGMSFRSFLLENDLRERHNIARNTGGVRISCPFLDVDMIETVVGLRRYYPDWRWGRKFWLKEAMKDFVPQFVLSRRKKQGFEPPVAVWVKALFEHYGSRILDGVLSQQNIFTEEGLKTLSLGAGIEAQALDGSSLKMKYLPWKALVLEMWSEWARSIRGKGNQGYDNGQKCGKLSL